MSSTVLMPLVVLVAMLWVSVAVSSDPIIPGDLDGDGDVDQGDLDMVVNCFGRTAAEQGCARADIAPPPDGDGSVNSLDSSYVASNFTPPVLCPCAATRDCRLCAWDGAAISAEACVVFSPTAIVLFGTATRTRGATFYEVAPGECTSIAGSVSFNLRNLTTEEVTACADLLRQIGADDDVPC